MFSMEIQRNLTCRGLNSICLGFNLQSQFDFVNEMHCRSWMSPHAAGFMKLFSPRVDGGMAKVQILGMILLNLIMNFDGDRRWCWW